MPFLRRERLGAGWTVSVLRRDALAAFLVPPLF